MQAGAPQGRPRPLSPEEMAARQRAYEEHRRRLEEEETQLELKYGAEQVLALIVPVSLCMIVVIATVRSVTYFATQNTQFVYSPYKESSSESSAARFGGALLNVVIIIGIVVAMTFLLVVLYKYRCYRAIHGWLVISSLLLLFFFSYQYLTCVGGGPGRAGPGRAGPGRADAAWRRALTPRRQGGAAGQQPDD